MSDIDFDQLVDRYIAVWNESDTARRADAVAAVFAEDGTFTDPLSDVRGHEGLEAVIAGVQKQFPGFVLRRGGPVDGHHGIARFTWELAPEAGGEALVVGFDTVVVGEDGRIATVLGFFDKVPAA
ncbi:nuclear transport factor 2 family protein [Wenjunlia tyrosinilytica]|uniref:Isomerase n=1 Tax=Wenjunlia tyrosinilytica TaxID=1544741 RepID=A0A917ZKI1_9ACTN|nr:nuclear transport factor 2 family protein [Wenjunlia tyrosinilytica]GGO84627.1 isomerase [Wenjunlia tyrosinilytica]